MNYKNLIAHRRPTRAPYFAVIKLNLQLRNLATRQHRLLNSA